MSDEFYYYDPQLGHNLSHDPFKSIVGPRPIGWISTVSSDGVYNLAPYSFFNAFSHRPPILGFSSKGFKDTVKNITDTKEFVWNLCTKNLAQAMNITSASVDDHIDEFKLAKISAITSQQVGAPRVKESPVSFECRVIDMFEMTDLQGKAIDTWFVFGQVVGVHIRKDVLVDGTYNASLARPVLRGGGITEYFTVSPTESFHMERA